MQQLVTDRSEQAQLNLKDAYKLVKSLDRDAIGCPGNAITPFHRTPRSPVH